ncbi:hypothetical protein M0804_000294 [Polistes exclamans]|nr:hypothetical protein M0804_000294 [Polistes exclamans]
MKGDICANPGPGVYAEWVAVGDGNYARNEKALDDYAQCDPNPGHFSPYEEALLVSRSNYVRRIMVRSARV